MIQPSVLRTLLISAIYLISLMSLDEHLRGTCRCGNSIRTARVDVEIVFVLNV